MLHDQLEGGEVISLSVIRSTGDFHKALELLRGGVRTGVIGKEIGTLPKQAQLLTEDCMMLTPPGTLNRGKKEKGVSFSGAQGVGNNRVLLDMRKIFRPLNPASFISPRLKALIERNDGAGWQAFARNVKAGPLAGTRAVLPTEPLHTENRDRRGRAKKTNFVTMPKQQSAFISVLNRAQAMVGWARSGWMRAYLSLGGTRAPSWVGRHGANGVFVDGTRSGDSSKWFIAVYNNTGWGKRGQNSQQIVDIAVRGRIKAMESYFRNQMRLAQAKFANAA